MTNSEIFYVRLFHSFSVRNIKHKVDSSWNIGFSSSVEATVIKRITGDWQLVLFFDNPVDIDSVWGAKKVFENKLSTLFYVLLALLATVTLHVKFCFTSIFRHSF